MKVDKVGKIGFSLKLDVGLYDTLRKVAFEQKVSMATVISQALSLYLKELNELRIKDGD